MTDRVRSILKGVRCGRISVRKAAASFKDLPYTDLGFAKVDHHRTLRRGFPEVIFGEGKTDEEILRIAGKIISHDGILLITRANERVFAEIKRICPKAKYDRRARAIYFRSSRPVPLKRKVLIITAGTADAPAAEEARVTLELMGCRVETIYDVGVAGIHRLLDKRPVLEKAAIIIVVAGMEGALASVVSGLVSKPVIAVPTSVGYGASFKGIAPLLTMMNSCSPGIAVVNIDNGFGAGYFAGLMNRLR
jgi:NCAIR mutase (PurE)-related protein